MLPVSGYSLSIVLNTGHGKNVCGYAYEYDKKYIEEQQINYETTFFVREKLGKYKTKDNKNIHLCITRAKNENPSISDRFKIIKRFVKIMTVCILSKEMIL